MTKRIPNLLSSTLFAVLLAACGGDDPTTGDEADLTSGVTAHTTVTKNNALSLKVSLPALVTDCEAKLGAGAAKCADRDKDGLADAWEDVVLDRTRPMLRLDEDESFMDDESGVLAAVGRVALVQKKPLRVRVFIMTGWSKDYGFFCFGVSGHHGDSERVALDLARPKGGGMGDVVMVGAYTAAHEGSSIDVSGTFTGSALGELVYDEDPTTSEPRWVVFPSADKHGTYANVDRCEAVKNLLICEDEDCAPDKVKDPSKYDVVPPIVNAGEDKARLVKGLAKIGFPNEDAWIDQKFCGGLGGDRSKCSSSVRSKLLGDPFVSGP